MDNQPAPPDDSVASCARCKFARVVPNTQNPLEKLLVCFFFPPTPMLAMTQHGPMLLPSTHAPVMATEWCYQFRRVENVANLTDASAPKLLGDDGKSILNS